jgi:long-chain acyl-CoA synthetase
LNDTLYGVLLLSAKTKQKKAAIDFYGRKISYEKLLFFVDGFAASLAEMGIKKHSVVTLCMPNSPSAQIAFYAINKLGGVVNLVHPYISAPRLDESIKKTKSSLLICYDLFLREKGSELSTDVPILLSRTDFFMPFLAKIVFQKKASGLAKFGCREMESMLCGSLPQNNSSVRNYARFLEDEPAVYLPSGGTTGSPKIIMHSCRVFNQLCSYAQFFLSEPIPNYSAMYSVLPIFHGFGLCLNMHMCIMYGIKNVMSIKFSPSAMTKAIKKEGVNIITGVPAMFKKLLENKHFQKADLRNIKDCFVGGDNASRKLVEDFSQLLAKRGSSSGLYVGYGLTETVTVCTVTTKKFNAKDSIGLPLPDTFVKIVSQGKEVSCGEIGEICVKSPLFMLGYLEQVEDYPIKEFEGESWLFTGDLGYTDESGFVYFKQRQKNMIKVNGVPVFPSEVEEIAESVEGVSSAAAIGMADENSGERVKLFVQSDREEEELKLEILKKCRKLLSPYAVPKTIVVKSRLAMSNIGKIDRSKLEEN